MTYAADLGEPLREIVVTPHVLPIPAPMPAMPAPEQEPVPA